MSALLAALRISRRDAWRAKGRSALIMAMIGLPVLVVTALLTFADTADISPREGLTARIGTADLRIWTTGFRPRATREVKGRPDRWEGPLPWTPAEIIDLLGPGTRMIPANEGSVDFRGEDGYDRVAADELDLRDPLTTGMYHLLRGRLPSAPGEIAVTPGTLERGARLDATLAITRKGTPMRVVGVIEHPHQVRSAEIVGFAGTLLFDRRDGDGIGWLADIPKPLDGEGLRKLNDAGLRVQAPAVAEVPVDPSDSGFFIHSGVTVEQIVGIGLAGVMIVLEVVLLAGPAFAVGLRRRRRELALIAAQGGSTGHLRMIVLADGIVLGGGAAVIGLALGVGLASLSAVLEAGRLIGGVGPLDIPWGLVGAIALIGAGSGIIAALVPAVQAARQDVAAVLGGYRSEARDRVGRPVLGLILLVVGVAAAVFAIRFDVIWVFAAAVLTQFGLVALTPRLVKAAARPAARLPLPFRLAARDASRHRGRTASAVAAVMTAAAAVTAVGVAMNSNFADDWSKFQRALPAGTTRISGVGLDDGQWAALRAAVERELPGVPLIEAAEPRDVRGDFIELGVGHFFEGGPYMGRFHSGGLPVGDERLLRLIQGRRDSAASAALAAGKAVVFDPRMVRDGRINLNVTTFTSDDLELPRDLKVPAVLAEAVNPHYAIGVLPVSALHRVGLRTEAHTLYIDPEAHRIDPGRKTQLERDLRAVGGQVDVLIDPGFRQDVIPQMMLLLGAALVLVLGGTFVATGLAAADLRPDLTTMAAVGAPPGTRRLVVAGQAGFIAGLGVLTGTVAGSVTGIAATWPILVQGRGSVRQHMPTGALPPFPVGAPTIEIPWLFLAAIVIGLPLLAAVVAGLFAETKVTLTRRVG